MGIAAMQVPTRTRGSKYDFSAEDVDAAIKLLGEGGNPGNGGYAKEGEARSAAAHLIEQIEASGKGPAEIGSRAWEDDKGKWNFALKVGKRKPNSSNGKASKG